MLEVLQRLVEAPTLLGNEEPGQAVMSEALREIGLRPVDVPMDADALRAHQACAPFSWDVSGKRNVTAEWSAPAEGPPGRSLILNGHVDIVSPEPVSLWRNPPFRAVSDGDWLYGRGAGDMKAGLAAILAAVSGLRELGMEPLAPVTIQSVVEEECGGNGSLACLLAGQTADAAVVTEPFGAAVTVSQVGVLWFSVRIAGTTAHVAEAGEGVNAIERSFGVISALRGLEAELNVHRPEPYDAYEHPINLNVGVIRGGDWPSTVAGECTTRFRIALYPGDRVDAMRERVRACVAAAAAGDPFLSAHPPVVEYDGFACAGYEIDAGHPLVTTLSGAFARQSGAPPALIATTGTTDARTPGLYGDTPSVCLGPYAEQVHGVDERVYVPSVLQTAQVLALFIRDWCGLRE